MKIHNLNFISLAETLRSEEKLIRAALDVCADEAPAVRTRVEHVLWLVRSVQDAIHDYDNIVAMWNSEHPVKAGVRHFVFDKHGFCREANIEEAAEAEGLTVPELLAKDAEELRKSAEQFDSPEFTEAGDGEPQCS